MSSLTTPMGKTEGELDLGPNVGPHQPSSFSSSSRNAASSCCCSFTSLIGLRCVLFLLLSVALFLSALFWLPPFLQFSHHGDELDLDPVFRDHDIVASFNLLKPVSLLRDNILQLEDNIFDEIVAPSTKVVVLSLESVDGSNVSRVVFGVDPDLKSSKLLPTSQSLIRESFEYLVTHQSLSLNASLFGSTSFFEVLKFPGGITIIPPQQAFLLQREQIRFNFTLNFPIYEIQLNFYDLKSQLKSGLHLSTYENLYVRLSNSKGSTVAAPTTVQSCVLLTVGNTQRVKQLAQTITHSHSRNLGLNNTVFGKVKQVRLSSILQHSLNGGDGPTPSPAPMPQARAHSHSHHHHHHHHHNLSLAPAISPAPGPGSGPPTNLQGAPGPADPSPKPHKSVPAPAPAPAKSSEAKPPSLWYGRRGKAGKQYHVSPAAAPGESPPVYGPSPQKHVDPSAPISRSVPASSPLPRVVFARARPPSKSESDSSHSYAGQSPGPSTSTSASAALLSCVHWALSLFLLLLLHL